MELAKADQQKLLQQLRQMNEAIEQLLLTGMTTASEATSRILGVTFQEASRLRLLRLSGTLRAANSEVTRFLHDEPDFSAKRLAFFLNRAWMLGQGLIHGLEQENRELLDRLLWTPVTDAAASLQVVTIGVVKKIAKGSFCSFEFRLRGVEDGKLYIWSTVFPMKKGVEIPAEGYLHLPQKQKFTGHQLLEQNVIQFNNLRLIQDSALRQRIQLTDESTVEPGAKFSDWQRFANWNPATSLQHLNDHETGPFDLEVELQEDIFLDQWKIGAAIETESTEQEVFPIEHRSTAMQLIISRSIEGDATRKQIQQQLKKKVPQSLFGLMHYERCQLVVQPLSILNNGELDYVTISKESVDQKALLQAIKFT
jgi:hypothetical protein